MKGRFPEGIISRVDTDDFLAKTASLPRSQKSTYSRCGIAGTDPAIDLTGDIGESCAWEHAPFGEDVDPSFHGEYSQVPHGRYWCGDCRSYFTARTGTPFEYAKLSCRQILVAGYMMMTHRKGISSLALSKELGISQPAAWYLEHRLRRATGTELEAVRKLLGIVEVDECYLGGVEKNKHAKKKLGVGGGTGGKQAVLCLKERKGRVILMPISDTTKKTLQGKIRSVVEPGSTINTDEHRAYKGIDVDGKFLHFKVSHSAREFVRAMTPKDFVTTNSAESVFAIVRRQFMGTHHWFRKKHTWLYMNEISFRLNQGKCAIATIDRLCSLFGKMAGKRIRLKELTAK